jgi:hypothetical protein
MLLADGALWRHRHALSSGCLGDGAAADARTSAGHERDGCDHGPPLRVDLSPRVVYSGQLTTKCGLARVPYMQVVSCCYSKCSHHTILSWSIVLCRSSFADNKTLRMRSGCTRGMATRTCLQRSEWAAQLRSKVEAFASSCRSCV